MKHLHGFFVGFLMAMAIEGFGFKIDQLEWWVIFSILAGIHYFLLSGMEKENKQS